MHRQSAAQVKGFPADDSADGACSATSTRLGPDLLDLAKPPTEGSAATAGSQKHEEDEETSLPGLLAKIFPCLRCSTPTPDRPTLSGSPISAYRRSVQSFLDSGRLSGASSRKTSPNKARSSTAPVNIHATASEAALNALLPLLRQTTAVSSRDIMAALDPILVRTAGGELAVNHLLDAASTDATPLARLDDEGRFACSRPSQHAFPATFPVTCLGDSPGKGDTASLEVRGLMKGQPISGETSTASAQGAAPGEAGTGCKKGGLRRVFAKGGRALRKAFGGRSRGA